MATITVEGVLALPSMRGTKVIAGAQGLRNEVQSVSVMEVPDIEAFVTPGSLLLTTAYPIHHDPQLLVDLAPRLHRKGLAGLAIKIGRYLDRIPKGLIRVCNQLDFPLLVLRDDLAFDVVIGEVVSVILTEGEEPKSSEQARIHLTELALSGGGLDGIATILADVIDCEVAIFDASGTELHRATGPKPLEAVADSDSSDPTLEQFVISVGQQTRGVLQTSSPQKLEGWKKRLAQQAAFAAGLHIAQSHAAVEVNRRLRALALEKLISHTDAHDDSQLDSSFFFSSNVEELRQVCVASYGSEMSTLDVEKTGETVWGNSSYTWVRGGNLVTIFDPFRLPGTLEESAHRWHSFVAEKLTKPSVAVGEIVDSAASLNRSYEGAKRAWQIARNTGRAWVRQSDLGMEMLLESSDRDLARSFVTSQIGPLLEFDLEHQNQMALTLHEYLGAPSARVAADRLFIHYNTLKYRINVIRELVPKGWDEPMQRLAVQLALELHFLETPGSTKPKSY